MIFTDGSILATLVLTGNIYGSLVFNNNKLNMNLTGCADVTLLGQAGDISVPPIGQVAIPISGAFDQVVSKTEDEFKDWFIHRNATVTFGKALLVTCTGESSPRLFPFRLR